MPSLPMEKRDGVNPFSYTKDELLTIYKEGGGQGGLGIEVERWEGVVREVGSEPVGLKDMSETEKKVRASLLE
jgi:PERQ amino acid-rich with GYF domain-containing protein